ncbi:D-2-hydroxyacid dehydrogenase [Alkalibacillus haloalkaliphilus]|uniref:D-2-hydroxyacid dehydrogenase n=1 Tax=Alkalibacillus haloalkaliphilus TaxID=94136 RepID=UPI0029363BEC|nr:D-2-hydroxyacid dehydrogenase [Alkalibacillus haloalkaliphilus]MDV2581884.1 D-2-hydroxyacid dehydrogenase [Alkalibacillus haloalkaliphilus]
MKIITTCRVKDSIKDQLVKRFKDVSFVWHESISEAEKDLNQAEVLITYGEDLEDHHIEAAHHLKWIMVISAGLDEMPFSKIEEKGVLVTNVRGIHAIPMAEYVIAMILQVSRQTKTLIENEKQHNWDRKVKMEEITGKTMLIAGTGAIGQEVARLAKAFRIETIGVSQSGKLKEHFDRCYKNDELNSLLGEADFVIGVLPATDETEYFFSKEQFHQMKESAIFLNMGRGKTVDEVAITKALKEKQFQHAVLDVFEEEPLDEESPLWDLNNCTITPHLSGISRHYQPRAFEIFEENLEVYIKEGKLVKNIIDPKRGY